MWSNIIFLRKQYEIPVMQMEKMEQSKATIDITVPTMMNWMSSMLATFVLLDN